MTSIILGNDFFVKAKVSLMPHLQGVLISNENQTCFVPAISNDKSNGMTEIVLALQLVKSLNKSHQT